MEVELNHLHCLVKEKTEPQSPVNVAENNQFSFGWDAGARNWAIGALDAVEQSLQGAWGETREHEKPILTAIIWQLHGSGFINYRFFWKEYKKYLNKHYMAAIMEP